MVVFVGASNTLSMANGLISTAIGTGTLSGAAFSLIDNMNKNPNVGRAIGVSSVIGGTASAFLGSALTLKSGTTGISAVTGAGISSILGILSGASVSSAICGMIRVIEPALIASSLGLAVLGAAQDENLYTFDCWKQIVHDNSTEPSNGRLVNDIIADPNVKQVKILKDSDSLEKLIVENIWNEEFLLEFFNLPTNGQLVAHAIKIA